jgi:sigma-E factor negative regulatory protein RseB
LVRGADTLPAGSRRRGLRAAALLCAGLFCGMAAAGERAAADDAAEWIGRMNAALANRNYDGVFVQQLGERKATMRIIHRVQDGHLTERLVTVDGTGREFLRDGNELVSYFPDRRIVVVEKRLPGLGYIGGLPGFDAAVQSNYEVRDAERVRMQGRPARLITLTPRDGWRFGYRFWIDEKTAMPVKTQLAGQNGEPVEQITFASLSLPPRIEDELLKPGVETDGFRWLRRDPSRVKPVEMLAWTAAALPPGFRRSTATGLALAGPPKPTAHLVFTDGLATVSVFIESASLPPQTSRTGEPRRNSGAAQLGAAAAFTVITEGYRVTAVGEVPPQTVRTIAESLRPVPESAAPLERVPRP